MDTIQKLKERRANVVQKMHDLVDEAEEEDRGFTAEEDEKWGRLKEEINELDKRIEKQEELERRDHRLEQSQGIVAARQDVDPDEGTAVEPGEDEEYRDTFLAWARRGMSALDAEQRSLMQNRMEQLTDEQRALAAGTDAAGGFTVPQDFFEQIEDALEQFGGMRRSRATVLQTSSGSDLPMPTADDTTNKGALVSENTQVTEADPSFGQKVLGAHMYTSKIVRVSLQLLQDNAVDIEAYLSRKLGERIGRITNEHFTTGTGTGQPEGIVTGAVEGVVGATGQTTSVTYDDLVDLEHSVDPAYRQAAEWMTHDNTVRELKKLKDTDGRPLWLPGIAVGAPDTILSYPYVVNQDMPQMAAGAKSILFGDLSKYHIRDVLNVQLLRLTERYADFLQVGFLAFSRHDGALLDAGTGPVAYYQNSAS